MVVLHYDKSFYIYLKVIKLANYKRVLDVVGASSALIVFTPIYLGVAIGVNRHFGRPIIFSQSRPGLGGKSFKMYKFRTMTNETDSNGDLLPDAQRLTPFGKFLRGTSLDELPEFWNVLKGDMSLVGPRPLLDRYLDRYTPHQARRHEVKPGITGFSQVNGRNAICWEECFDMDVWYVDNHSLLLDVKIMAKTVKKVLMRADISEGGEATKSEFMGSVG